MNDANLKEKTALLREALKKRQTALATTSLFPKYISTSNLVLMSDNQKRIWLHEQQLQDQSLYSLPFVLNISGLLDIPILQAALTKIIARHEILRTTFLVEDGEHYQKIMFGSEIKIVVKEHLGISGKPLKKILNHIVKEPFDLAKAELLRVLIIKTSETEQLLTIVMHHIIGDGWSLGILINELFLYYDKIAKNLNENLEPLSRQYRDFAQWQHEFNNSPKSLTQMDYWSNQLTNLPILQLPTDMNRIAKRTYLGKRLSLPINDQLWKKIEMLARQEGVSIFAFLLTVYGILLHHLAQQNDFAVGIATANRNFPELQKLIGFFANTLPVRIRVNATQSFSETLQQTKETLMSLFANQDISFEKLSTQNNYQRLQVLAQSYRLCL